MTVHECLLLLGGDALCLVLGPVLPLAVFRAIVVGSPAPTALELPIDRDPAPVASADPDWSARTGTASPQTVPVLVKVDGSARAEAVAADVRVPRSSVVWIGPPEHFL